MDDSQGITDNNLKDDSSDLLVKESSILKKKKREFKMTEEEKELNRKILKNMNKKQNYHKNKRFSLMQNKRCLLYSNQLFGELKHPDNPFVVDPPIVIFRNYLLNCIYQIDLKLINRTQLLCNFHYLPPVTENFTVKRIIFPKKDSSLIAPGMNAKLEILFNATSLDNFEDEVTVICELFAFKVQLRGIRDSPALSLQNPLNCNSCLVGDQVNMLFRCTNNGGDAHFKFMSNNNSNLMGLRNQLESPKDSSKEDDGASNNYESEHFNIGPFSIFPREFYLHKGAVTYVEANFCPMYNGHIEEDFILCCDSKVNLPFKLTGEGILIDLIIMELDGNRIEDNGMKLENIYFNDSFPYSSTTKNIKIKNNSLCSAKFHWSIIETSSDDTFNLIDEQDFFEVSPNEGNFEPNQEINFIIKFSPKNAMIYEQKLELIIEDIPLQSIKNFDNPHISLDKLNNDNKSIKAAKSEPFMLAANSPYPSYPLFSFKLIGSGKLCQLEVDPFFIDLGDVYLYQKIKKSFTITNSKTNILTFKLKEMLQILLIKGENTIHPFFKEYLEIKPCIKKIINKRKQEEDMHELSLEVGLLEGHLSVPIKNDIDFKYIDSLYDRFENDINYTKVGFLKVMKKSSEVLRKVVSPSNSNNSPRKKLSQQISKKFSSPKLSILQSKKSLPKKDLSLITDSKTHSITNLSSNFINEEVEVDEGMEFCLKLLESLELSVNFTPNIIGVFKASLVFNVVDGIPFSLEVKGNVIGPSISIDVPFLNFGLVLISDIKYQTFKVKNTSKIACRFLIKESRFKNINLSNYLESDYVEDYEGEITEKIYRDKIETMLDFEKAKTIDPESKDLYKIKFSKVTDIIQPDQTYEIIATFISPYPLIYREIIEIQVENSEPSYVNIYADVQEAISYLSYTDILPKSIYLSVPITYDNNIVTLHNPSNLPINFQWINVMIDENVTAEFNPNKGVIPPKGKVDIMYKIVFYRIREVDDLFICKINEMELPLGIVIKGKVTGLDIVYELPDEHFLNRNENASIISSSMTGSIISSDKPRKNNARRSNFGNFEKEIDKTLRSIDFKNLKVNRNSTMTFIIKNESGISTNYAMRCLNYPPGIEKTLKSEIAKREEEKDTESKVTISTSKLSKIKKHKNEKAILSHSMLNDAHEQINFSSAKGAEFTKQKQLEKDSILYLSSKKGVAIVIFPNYGVLEAHSEVTITVSVFNECVGDLEDELICDIKGLDTRRFPINMKIRGNPLQLSPFQPGIEYLQDPPVLKMGNVLTKSNNLDKSFKLLNTSSNPLTVEWKIYDYKDIFEPTGRNIFKIKLDQKKTSQGITYKLQYKPLEPKEFEEENYTIEPKVSTILSKSTKDFRLTFRTYEPGPKSALIVAYPKFDDTNNSKIKLSELALKIDARGVSPNIVVDKFRNFDEQIEYKFEAHSFGLSPKLKRTITFINQEKIGLHCRLAIQGPYKISKVEPMHSVISEMLYNIMPNTNLCVDVKYYPPSVNDEDAWPMTLLNEKHGKLTLTFENGEFQEFFLKSVLKRPRISMSTSDNEAVETSNFISFGHVNVESMKKSFIFIMNETDVDTKWKINYIKVNLKKVYGHKTITQDEKEDIEKTDDPDVFKFNITEGIISGPSIQLNNIPLGPGMPKISDNSTSKYHPLKVEIMFKPKKKLFYKSLYRITSETGNSLDFILKGNGSYLEEFL